MSDLFPPWFLFQSTLVTYEYSPVDTEQEEEEEEEEEKSENDISAPINDKWAGELNVQ